jgi:hypothetical protein
MKRRMIKLIRIRLVAAWVLAVTLLVSGSSGGLVLCIAGDGHVALEPAHQGQCGGSIYAEARAHGEVAVSGAGSLCVSNTGGCVDVSLGLDTVSRVVKDVRPDRVLSNDSLSTDLSAGPIAMTCAEGQRTQRLARGAMPRLSCSLLAQRTIVLRI